MSTSSNIVNLLPAFKKKFFYNWGKEKIAYGIQRRDAQGLVGYDRKDSGAVTDSLLLQHFSQKPLETRYYDYGSLAILANWKVVKWICIDADTPEQIEVVHNLLLPQLDSYSIKYLIEPSREGRMHIWFFTSISPEHAERFMLQVMTEIDQKTKDWEIYPLFHRRKAIIRIPGGYHFKSGKANGILLDGVEQTDPSQILTIINEAPIHYESDLPIRSIEPKRINLGTRPEKYVPFEFLSRNLPLPQGDMPSFVKKVAMNCRAYNQLISQVIGDGMIEKQGVLHHNAGLALGGLAASHDYASCSDEGKKWFDNLRETYRSRSDQEHNWDFNYEPGIKVWKCETMDTYFGECGGCPFARQESFVSPKQFFYGEEILATITEAFKPLD